MELLSHSQILAALSTDSLACLEILDVVDATNRYALEQLKGRFRLPVLLNIKAQDADGKDGNGFRLMPVGSACLSNIIIPL